MQTDPLLTTLREHYDKQLPFVVYTLPGSDTLTGLFQHDDRSFTTASMLEAGFVMAEFDKETSVKIIPLAHSDKQIGRIAEMISEEEKVEPTAVDGSRASHMELVSKAVESISHSELKKVVISRKEDVELKDFDIKKLAQRLFSNYRNAFRYLWFHPKTGIWCAASPELLVSISANNLKTMSLAGTRRRSNQEDRPWTEKEIEEQLLVTASILQELKPFTTSIETSDTYTSSAGLLEHLRTDITGVLRPDIDLKQLVDKIHPTPAVCGYPREVALDFILKNESYDRSFYTGYAGPLDIVNNQSALFVNLRCMRISEEVATIYTGGGITAMSDPHSEWIETCNKQQTMLKLLYEFL